MAQGKRQSQTGKHALDDQGSSHQCVHNSVDSRSNSVALLLHSYCKASDSPQCWEFFVHAYLLLGSAVRRGPTLNCDTYSDKIATK